MRLAFGFCVLLAVVLDLPGSRAEADTVYFTASDAVWRYRAGTGEASAPVSAWRLPGFDDTAWMEAPAPIWYSSAATEPPFHPAGAVPGTVISGMQNGFSCIFLRKMFTVANPTLISELQLNAACDDGFIAWINGVEVVRYNVPTAAPASTTLAGNSVNEPAAVDIFGITNTSMLTSGANVLAVQVFNSALDSSDLGFMAGLLAPVDVTPPGVAGTAPPAGATLGELTRLEVTFSEAVTGVEAADLRINLAPAAAVSGSGSGPYVFTFPEPVAGAVSVAWEAGHGIADGSGNLFAGGAFNFTLDPGIVVPLARITELMAANSSTLDDEDGDDSDWLEIHNPRQTTLDLGGWFLTDNPGTLTKWRFPAVGLPPGARLVVFASGKNRAVAGAPLHTNFSLSSNGEFLALVAVDGATVVSAFSPAFPGQTSDRSYGAAQDSGPDAYLLTSTPGATNSAALGAALVADTKFSPGRGLYEAPVSVAITTETPGAVIRYTTNGSIPTATSGTLYTGSLSLNRTTVLRAAAFKSGSVPSNVDTHTYLFLSDALTQSPGNAAPPGWPASSVNGQRLDYEMDPRVVTHSNTALGGAAQVLAGLRALPSLSVTLPQSDLTGAAAGIYVNASQRGAAWERAASVELLNDADQGDGFKANAGLRIRGNFSRDGNNPKHSFRLLFRSEYGDAKLRYPLYGPEAAQEFDALDVQSPQDFSWAFYDPALCNYLRDTWSRDTQGALGQPHARSRWLHLFLNGVYWGIYQIEERPEATFAANYLGGDDDDFDVIKNTGFAEDFRIEATDGILTGPPGQPSAWERFFSGCRAHFATPAEDRYFALQGLLPDGVTPSAAPDAVLLDPDNLADYLLMVMHSANTDMASSIWVGQKPNNFYGLRRRGGTRGFVWVAHDGETSLDYYSNSYDRTGPVNGSIRSTFIYSNPEFFHNDLLPSAAWRTRFGDRAHRALYNNGPLSPEACAARLDARAAELAQAIIPESARWGDAQRGSAPYTKADWQARVNATRNWFTGRRESLISQLKADGLYPTVSAPVFNRFGGTFPAGATLTMSAPAGTIYYSIDGTDPRQPDGSLSPDALTYSAGVPLTWTTRVQARARSNGNWSALVDASFFAEQDASRLTITEVHYHPSDEGTLPGEELEFLELQNTGNEVLDLGLMRFTRGLTFEFPIGTRLAPSAFCVLGRNAAALEARHPGLTLDGVFTGRLDDSGETLELATGPGTRVAHFAFDDDPPWPSMPDGGGPSLTLRAPGLDPGLPASWRPSYASGGTPGRPDVFPVAAWRAMHFTPAELSDPAGEASLWGDGADPDADGFANLLEYALGGTSPRDGASAPALTSQLFTNGGETWLRGTFLIHEGLAGVAVRAEASNDLEGGSWQPLTPFSSLSLGDNTTRVTVQLPLSAGHRRFLRIRAESAAAGGGPGG